MALPPTTDRHWTCDGCGSVSPWTAEHRWYGSIRDQEAEAWDLIVVVCSLACRVRATEAGMLPSTTTPRVHRKR